MTDRSALVRDLAEVLNRHSAENGSNTPDFVLAEYLVDCLVVHARASRARERYFNVQHVPGRSPEPFKHGDVEIDKRGDV